ncbi:MAG: glycoside hydrolase family 88 protein [Bacteroidota bacterium]|nr:glycoside hydrolase family 88 protein [Bacteroidota bacterium]
MRSIFLFCCISLLCLKGITQNERLFQPDAKLLSVINKNFSDADEQYRVLMKMVPENEFPKTFFPATRKYEFSSADWWCSGFYAGTLLNLFRETNDTLLWHEAIKSMHFLQKEEFNTGTHDLGFMMYSSFGTANKISPSKNYEQVLMNSAKSLITRFNAKVGCIKSWDNTPWKFPVIIDNMMNLELLFWATKFSGDSSFYHIAVTHANTTMKNHYRPDYSSYHMVNYDPNTGNVIGKITVQGYADSSAWARGQAWGLYGYTVAYRETKDNKYLQQAEYIADFILHHPNYPSDGIPYWDFNVPNIPHALRDASAASVLASALLELYKYVDLPHAKNYVAAAEKIITTLSSPQYKAVIGTNGGFILEHSVGHMPSKSEIDVPLTYADYYFVEAMMRYRNLGK